MFQKGKKLWIKKNNYREVKSKFLKFKWPTGRQEKENQDWNQNTKWQI
jgi:hypothetical protein